MSINHIKSVDLIPESDFTKIQKTGDTYTIDSAELCVDQQTLEIKVYCATTQPDFKLYAVEGKPQKLILHYDEQEDSSCALNTEHYVTINLASIDPAIVHNIFSLFTQKTNENSSVPLKTLKPRSDEL